MTRPLAKPTPAQAAWQDLELGMFIHWSPGTYENTDSGHDRLLTPLSMINPDRLDTEQWVDVAESMGAKYIVMVAKHVGGFCVWQTETTDYGVRNTPWRNGKGDMMKDLSESCRRRGIKLGVYLSPQDRHYGAKVGGVCATPEKQREYDHIHRQQLTELLTRYGPIAEVWFDGSNVVEVGDLVAAHAPHAMVLMSRHTTIRWAGNEEGIATYPAWNAVSESDARTGIATNRHGTPDGDVWMPLECNTTIRANWFWTEYNEPTLKSLDYLMTLYYRSVGNGAVLLLNHNPDRTGRIPEPDAARAAEFGREIRLRFGVALAETAGGGERIELPLNGTQTVDHAILMEDISQGERIRLYAVEGWDGAAWKTLCRGTAVGHKRIERFAPVAVSKLRLNCLKCAAPPLIRKFAAYGTGVPFTDLAPTVSRASRKVGEWGSEIYYGVDWRDGAEVEYDITDAVDNAGQFELTFVKTGGADGFEVAAVTVFVEGAEYPDWMSRTGGPATFNISIPGVAPNIRLKARIRGKGGPDCTGVVFLTRSAAGEPRENGNCSGASESVNAYGDAYGRRQDCSSS